MQNDTSQDMIFLPTRLGKIKSLHHEQLVGKLELSSLTLSGGSVHLWNLQEEQFANDYKNFAAHDLQPSDTTSGNWSYG